ncbi:Rv3654c family TadE-like protein [Acaricomes phytoseiuli]|uniref:Rv3654c family TadE-like protein n=1 Tax=Acaricomes phytoseiuli TaxID=291968 RepID=UPI001461333B|nr:Rv3654c family TadE-like protein [Acaricomes phytoseiuli]
MKGAKDRRKESGATTVLVAVIAAFCILSFTLIAAWFTAAQAQKNASNAADLGALAAADAARGLSAGEPCRVSEALVQRHGAQQESCAIEATGDTVKVTVTMALPGMLQPLGPARAQARAGLPPDG